MMCLLSAFKACTICKTASTCTTLVRAQTDVESVLVSPPPGHDVLAFSEPQTLTLTRHFDFAAHADVMSEALAPTPQLTCAFPQRAPTSDLYQKSFIWRRRVPHTCEVPTVGGRSWPSQETLRQGRGYSLEIKGPSNVL